MIKHIQTLISGQVRIIGLTVLFLIASLQGCSSYDGRETDDFNGTIEAVLNFFVVDNEVRSFAPAESAGEGGETELRYTQSPDASVNDLLQINTSSGIPGEGTNNDLPTMTDDGRALSEADVLLEIDVDEDTQLLSEIRLYDLRRDLLTQISNPLELGENSDNQLNERIFCSHSPGLEFDASAGQTVLRKLSSFYLILSNTNCEEESELIPVLVELKEQALNSETRQKSIDGRARDVEVPSFALDVSIVERALAKSHIIGQFGQSTFGYIGYDRERQQLRVFDSDLEVINAISIAEPSIPGNIYVEPRFYQFISNDKSGDFLYLDWGWDILRVRIDDLMDSDRRNDAQNQLSEVYFPRTPRTVFEYSDITLREDEFLLNSNGDLYFSPGLTAPTLVTTVDENDSDLVSYKTYIANQNLLIHKVYNDRHALVEVSTANSIENTRIASNFISIEQVEGSFFVTTEGDIDLPAGSRESVASTFGSNFFSATYENTEWLIVKDLTNDSMITMILSVDDESNVQDGKLVNPSLYYYDVTEDDGRGEFLGRFTGTIDSVIEANLQGEAAGNITFYSDREAGEIQRYFFDPVRLDCNTEDNGCSELDAKASRIQFIFEYLEAE